MPRLKGLGCLPYLRNVGAYIPPVYQPEQRTDFGRVTTFLSLSGVVSTGLPKVP